MQELTLGGVHDDGEHLVLEAPGGQRFLVRVDEALRVAVRRDRARLGQLQLQADGRLRPREIQARIRAGQSAEEVADAAGVPLEHVRRYEGPVLAEREFVVRQARAVRVRRGSAAVPVGGTPTLEDLVHQRLSARDVDPGGATWDAWRSEDGTWVVALSFAAGGRDRQARWAYDVQLRHVSPQEDEARWLTDEEPAPPTTQRRLAPVRGTQGGESARAPQPRETLLPDESDVEAPARPDSVYDVEVDDRAPAAEPPRGRPGPVAATTTVDLLDTLRERRGRRQRVTLPDDEPRPAPTPVPTPVPTPTPAGPRDSLDVALESLRLRTSAPDVLVPPAQPDEPEDVVVLPGRTSTPARSATDDTSGSPEEDSAVSPDALEDGDPRTPARRSRRASVPSWDDIVFGSRRE